jgi:hypothetical protein
MTSGRRNLGPALLSPDRPAHFPAAGTMGAQTLAFFPGMIKFQQKPQSQSLGKEKK